jgi:Protein of unknown function (DUF705)
VYPDTREKMLQEDDRRPDLVLPQHFDLMIHANHPSRRQLVERFNIFSPSNLPIQVDRVRPILVSDCPDQPLGVLSEMKLKPYFTAAPLNEPGVTRMPHWTTYQLRHEQPLYSIDRRQPRYVIWPADEPLTVCGTVVDRIPSADDLLGAVQRALDWSYTISESKSIIVFDLDETLIDAVGKPLEDVQELLRVARNSYDLMVLYSHGSHLHVDESRYGLGFDHLFDLQLSNGDRDHRSSKNLLYLYNLFEKGIRFTEATLVDDSPYNWTPEYTRFVIPARGIRSVRNVPLSIDPRTHSSSFESYFR